MQKIVECVLVLASQWFYEHGERKREKVKQSNPLKAERGQSYGCYEVLRRARRRRAKAGNADPVQVQKRRRRRSFHPSVVVAPLGHVGLFGKPWRGVLVHVLCAA